MPERVESALPPKVSVSVANIQDYLASKQPEDRAGLVGSGHWCLSASTIAWKYGEEVSFFVGLRYIDVYDAPYYGDYAVPIDPEVLEITDEFDKWGEHLTPHTVAEVYERFPQLRKENNEHSNTN